VAAPPLPSFHGSAYGTGAWPRSRTPMPLSLSDDEYNAVRAAAAPIHPLQRDAFLKALAVELVTLNLGVRIQNSVPEKVILPDNIIE
jgi:hypothetical protein